MSTRSPADIPVISAEVWADLQDWVDEQAAAGLAAGTLVVRPGGAPRRGELLAGLVGARIVLMSRPPCAERPGRGIATFLLQAWQVPDDPELLALRDETLAHHDRLMANWHSLGVACWRDAAQLWALGDLADDSGFQAEVDRRMMRVLQRLRDDPRGPEAAWHEDITLALAYRSDSQGLPRVIISQRSSPIHSTACDDGL